MRLPTFRSFLKFMSVFSYVVLLTVGCGMVILGAYLEIRGELGLGTMFAALGIVAIALMSGLASLQMKYLKV